MAGEIINASTRYIELVDEYAKSLYNVQEDTSIPLDIAKEHLAVYVVHPTEYKKQYCYEVDRRLIESLDDIVVSDGIVEVCHASSVTHCTVETLLMSHMDIEHMCDVLIIHRFDYKTTEQYILLATITRSVIDGSRLIKVVMHTSLPQKYDHIDNLTVLTLPSPDPVCEIMISEYDSFDMMYLIGSAILISRARLLVYCHSAMHRAVIYAQTLKKRYAVKTYFIDNLTEYYAIDDTTEESIIYLVYPTPELYGSYCEDEKTITHLLISGYREYIKYNDFYPGLCRRHTSLLSREEVQFQLEAAPMAIICFRICLSDIASIHQRKKDDATPQWKWITYIEEAGLSKSMFSRDVSRLYNRIPKMVKNILLGDIMNSIYSPGSIMMLNKAFETPYNKKCQTALVILAGIVHVMLQGRKYISIHPPRSSQSLTSYKRYVGNVLTEIKCVIGDFATPHEFYFHSWIYLFGHDLIPSTETLLHTSTMEKCEAIGVDYPSLVAIGVTVKDMATSFGLEPEEFCVEEVIGFTRHIFAVSFQRYMFYNIPGTVVYYNDYANTTYKLSIVDLMCYPRLPLCICALPDTSSFHRRRILLDSCAIYMRFPEFYSSATFRDSIDIAFRVGYMM